MHLIERYATSCGVKIGKPYIYETFFPIPVEKYISFQPFSKYQSKNYDYWEEVINIINPYIQKENIKIIQIGAKDDKHINGTINLSGQTKISQAAYIIKNSIMHFGADSFATHVASGFNKKIVCIYSNNNINNVKPYWSKEEDVALLKPNTDKKPEYSANEFPKSINKINPEDIAKNILNLLNIKYSNLPKTIYIGDSYISKTFEIVPDKQIDISKINIETFIIRMDYCFNEEVLEYYLQNKKCIILTNKLINEKLLKIYKDKITQLIYIIEKDNDPNFAKILKNNTINAAYMSYLTEEELNLYKLDYMDYGLIIRKDYPTKNIDIDKNVYFKSSKIILSSEGQFNTRYQLITKDLSNKYIDNDELKKELENLYIFSID